MWIEFWHNIELLNMFFAIFLLGVKRSGNVGRNVENGPIL